jgi:hypothetical protein
MGSTTLQRTQVGAVLDLENLLHTARRSSGMAVRAQFSAIVEEVRGIGDIRSAIGCCDRWLARLLVPVTVQSGIRIFPGLLGKDRADGDLELRPRVVVLPAAA